MFLEPPWDKQKHMNWIRRGWGLTGLGGGPEENVRQRHRGGVAQGTAGLQD